MGNLLCFGEALFELSDMGAGKWQEGIGGDISNVAIAAARQGARARVISRLGSDLFGRRIRRFWDREGVDHSQVVQCSEASTGLYMITCGEDGHDFSYRRAGSAASLINPSNFDVHSVAQYANGGVLHATGITMAIGAGPNELAQSLVHLTCQSGGMASYDPNLRLRLTTLDVARADQLAIFKAGARIALPGLDDARLLVGKHAPEDIIDFYHDIGAEIVGLTCGTSGAIISTAEGRTHISPPITKLVDASAAGDCFNGAFIARLLAGDSPAEAGRYAVYAASLSTQGHGTVNAIPHIKDVIAAFPNN